MDEELEALLENGEGLNDEKQVVSLCRLMVRVETMEQRLTCVKLIQVGTMLKIITSNIVYISDHYDVVAEVTMFLFV